MGRWEPDARSRLEQAALELFSMRGFDETTVAEIAQRAGRTERTFFRYYADKREVLFGGLSLFSEIYRDAINNAPDTLSPFEMVYKALLAISEFLEGRREIAQKRQKVIIANPELQERELLKQASITAVVTKILCARGIAESSAGLASDIGSTIFTIAFQRWASNKDSRTLAEHIKEVRDQLGDTLSIAT
jgi:AcrR family transcriptional regulator